MMISENLPPSSLPCPESLLELVDRAMAAAVAPPGDLFPGAADPVSAAARHHLATGGARMRARLALSAALSLDLGLETAVALAAACELLHNASLIHDDLQDRDAVRRGAPSVWAKFGDAVAVCVGDLFLSGAYAAAAGAGPGAPTFGLVALMHRALAEATRGQCLGFDLAETPACDLAAYEAAVRAKSGALLSLPLELALTAAGERSSLQVARRAAGHFALGYQIADDLCDYLGDLGDEDRPGSVNIVHVLAASGRPGSPFREAAEIARRHLRTAGFLSMLLPANCGQLILSLSQDVSLQLKVSA